MRNEQETYSDEQDLAAAATHTSDNVIDHGVEGLGLTEGLWLVVVATTTFVGPTAALTVLLETDTTDAFGSATTKITIPQTDQTPAAGSLLVQQHMPVIDEQFSRVRITHTTNASAGAFSAYLTDNPQKEQPLA